ncbi:MAG: exodeoxyribonuclease VII large subunit [Sphingomonadaceae bacterium]
MSASNSDNANFDGLVARQRAGDNAEPMTITEISSRLKRSVEEKFGYVRLRGELSGVKRAASGHLYCSLKDEKAVMDAVMWRGNAGRLPFAPEDGLEVIASGKLTTYPGRSKYQIVMESMEIAGEGALLALLEKTRTRLAAEGLFDRERKRPLPYLPRVIGVVTSPTGAVIRDILHRLADRFPSHVLVWPVMVQGQGAAEQIASAIRGFCAISPDGPVPRPDVVIIARGGGSIEDLWCFNEEIVVRAVAECSIPTISAVGHETDTTLCDYAADMRAPTPTAAAEMAVPVKIELAATLADMRARLQRAAYQPVALGRERLAARADRLPAVATLLDPQTQKLDDLAERLRRGLKDRAQDARNKLLNLRASPVVLTQKLANARDALVRNRLQPVLLHRAVETRQERLASLSRIMQSLNPEMVLARGYARVSDLEGTTITHAATARKNAALMLHFQDGTVAVHTQQGTSPPARKPRQSHKGASHRQDDLFE